MKKSLVLVMTLLLHTNNSINANSAEKQPILLEADILSLIDGTSFGMSGAKVGTTIRFRLDLSKRRTGKTTTGIVRFYTFEDQKYTLEELIALEDKLLASNRSTDAIRYDALRKCLEDIKIDFIELSRPILMDARGAKSQMVILISEWAQKTHRQNSLLLEWAHTSEGDEYSIVYKKMTSIRSFDQFCDDLIYFLETLLRSCPKGCAQFKTMMEQKQKEQQQSALRLAQDE